MLEWGSIVHWPLFVSMWKGLVISPNLAFPHVWGWGKGIPRESRLGTKPFSTHFPGLFPYGGEKAWE